MDGGRDTEGDRVVWFILLLLLSCVLRPSGELCPFLGGSRLADCGTGDRSY